MIKYRIETENGYLEIRESPVAIKKIQTLFLCGGVDHFTYADAQIYQVENSPKDEEGTITELLPITESETTIDTKELVW